MTTRTLDPVTFEVLKNSFITSVDQMAEQILRTCYSFVIYNRDFSSALHDARGDSAAQGNQDIAVHVGTLHFTCKDVIRAFEPFARLEGSRNRNTGGTGLGLTIAKRAVEAEGGTLDLINRSEGGLRAEIRLPRTGPGD